MLDSPTTKDLTQEVWVYVVHTIQMKRLYHQSNKIGVVLIDIQGRRIFWRIR